MAVLASASITLVTSVDIDSVYWFYLLQASTSAAPAKPTAVPATKGNAPSGWTTAEPTTVDINKTLYRVELTYFTDGTGIYSTVHKVSSYEAAKVAYNKATDVQTNLDNLEIGGRNLIRNTGKSLTKTETGTTSNTTLATDGIWTDYAKTKLVAGTTLITSAKIDVVDAVWEASPSYTRAGVECSMKVNSGNSTIYPGVWYDKKGSSFSGIVTKKITLTTDATTYPNVNWYVQGLKSGTVTISNPKIEIGDIATDWTPAPEDQEALIYDNSSELILGTQTAATGSWTGVSQTITALKDGTSIAYWLPYAGSGSATLNLTLKGGGTTGAVNVYYRGATRATTHFVAGSIIHLTYRVNANVNGTNYTGWWADASYDSGDTVNRTQFNSNITAATAITSGRIICGTSSGYKNIAANIAFDLTYPLLYSRAAIAAAATGNNNDTMASSITFSSNGTITSGAANKALYLKGKLAGSTFTIAASPFMTTVPPTTADGYHYIPLGVMSSATVGTFVSSNRVYAYLNGSFQPLDLASKGLADAAQTTANTAQSTANTAKTTADAAKTAADSATSTANTAATNASAAKTAADNALINTKYNGPVNVGAAITANRLIMNTTTAANSAASYKMVAKNTAYNIESPILYSATALSTGNIALANHTCYLIANVSITGQGGVSSLTVNRPVFLKGKLNGNTFTTTNDANFVTMTQPTTVDGYHYIFLGTATSTTNILLQAEHPIYMYTGGGFHRIGSSSDTIVQKWVYDTSAAIASAKLDGGIIAEKTILAESIYVEDLSALGATIGGFTIDSDSIHTTDTSTSSTAANAIWLSSKTFTRAINGTSRSSLKFAIGGCFAVDNDGWLYASHATINGTSTIAGFTVDDTSIRSGTLTSNASASVGLSSSTFTRTVAGASRANLKFAIGSGFGVNNTGVLYANNAVINGSSTFAGAITATTLRTTANTATDYNGLAFARWDHMVMFTATSTLSEVAINDWTVPSGYRPTRMQMIPGIINKNGSGSYKSCIIYITTAGVITVYAYDTYGSNATTLNKSNWETNTSWKSSTVYAQAMWLSNDTYPSI